MIVAKFGGTSVGSIKRIKKIPNLKGQKIFYPGEQKFLRTKTNSKKSIKIPKNITKSSKKLNLFKV